MVSTSQSLDNLHIRAKIRIKLKDLHISKNIILILGMVKLFNY